MNISKIATSLAATVIATLVFATSASAGDCAPELPCLNNMDPQGSGYGSGGNHQQPTSYNSVRASGYAIGYGKNSGQFQSNVPAEVDGYTLSEKTAVTDVQFTSTQAQDGAETCLNCADNLDRMSGQFTGTESVGMRGFYSGAPASPGQPIKIGAETSAGMVFDIGTQIERSAKKQ